MKKGRIIVTAHDVGLSHSVNIGVKYAISQKENIFTELSLLLNAPGSNEAAKIFKNYNIPINLCLVFSKFKPLFKNAKTLITSNGNLKKVDVETWDFSCIDDFDPKELENEINAQWDLFIKHVGRKPSALVSQKSEHGDPKILIPFVKKAKKENVPIRTPYWKWKRNYAAESYVVEQGLKSVNNIIICCRDWKGRFGKDLEEDLEEIKKTVCKNKGPTEILLFCGFVDEETYKLSSLTWQRGQYLNILKYNPSILLNLKEEFELISYADI